PYSRTSCRVDGVIDGGRAAAGDGNADGAPDPAPGAYRPTHRPHPGAARTAGDASARTGRCGHLVADTPPRRRPAGVRGSGRPRTRARLARGPPPARAR